jgi:hypothetical protein
MTFPDAIPELFFDEDDSQWSVRWFGKKYSDLAAAEHDWHSVRMTGEVAYELNMISEMLMLSAEVGVTLVNISADEIAAISERVTPEILDHYIQKTLPKET